MGSTCVDSAMMTVGRDDRSRPTQGIQAAAATPGMSAEWAGRDGVARRSAGVSVASRRRSGGRIVSGHASCDADIRW